MDTDHDSDQSEDLFGDDENYLSVRGSSIQSPEIDASFKSLPLSQACGCSPSPYKQPDFTAPECPTTPCSLGPHLTKAPIWTADLETPEANKGRMLPVESPCNINQENISYNALRLTPTDFNIEDVIPVSPVVPRAKKKRLSRRILSNISNATSQSSHFKNEYSNIVNSTVYLSPIAEKSMEERLDDSNRSFSSNPSSSTSGIRSSGSMSPVERFRMLKELKASKISRLNQNDIIQIPDTEFFKDYVAMETNKYSCQPQGKLKKPRFNEEGFVTFTQLAKDDNEEQDEEVEHPHDESYQHDQDIPLSQFFREDNPVFNNKNDELISTECSDSDKLIATVKTPLTSPDFKGFSPVSRQRSQVILNKHNDLVSEQAHQHLSSSEDNLKGFNIHELDKSIKIAQRYQRFYDNYLDSNYPLGKKLRIKYSSENVNQDKSKSLLPPLIINVCSLFKTASNKDILVAWENVGSSKLLLLCDDGQHDIDLLVDNHEESTAGSDSREKKIEDLKNVTDEFESLEFNVDLEEAVSRVESTEFDNLNSANCSVDNKNECRLNLMRNNSFKPVVTNLDVNSTTNDKIMFKQPVIKNLIGKQSTNVNKSCVSLANSTNIFDEDLQFDGSCEAGVVGFQTGRGKSIKIADNALVRARNILADDELNKIDLEKEGKLNGQRRKEFNEPVASTSGFKVGRDKNSWVEKSGLVGKNIFTNRNLKESAITKNIFDDKNLEDLPMNPVMMGFQTGRGKNIKIDDNALMKAKNILADDELNKINLEKQGKLNGQRKKEFNEPVASTSGFKVGQDKNNCVKKNIFDDENLGDLPINPMAMGFQTGSGKNIKIAESALSRAQATFVKDLEDADCENKILEMKKGKINQRFSYPGSSTFRSRSGSGSGSGFSTGSGTGLLINNSVSINNARKRKATDDETPAGRKRLCGGLDLQKRKLFNDIEEEDESLLESAMLLEQDLVDSDRNLVGSTLQAKRIDANVNLNSSIIINDEVRASVDALLNEDIDFEAEDTWVETANSDKQIWSGGSEGSYRNQDHPKPEKRSRSFPGSVAKSPKHDSIPEELYFETQFSEEFNGGIEEIHEQRSAAALEQEKIIMCKKKMKVKPTVGSLLKLKRADNKISLAQYSSNHAPVHCTSQELRDRGLDPSITSINSTTASAYKFSSDYFEDLRTKVSVPVGDGAVLVPDKNNQVGVDEFSRSFLASPGVDPSLLPQGWFKNHYRWIVWKLGSMDRIKLNSRHVNKFLTPDILMRQLKYRYDREIDRSERPALRRILEKDDPPSRRLVLCVCQVVKDTIELTDGWYSVPASVDSAMQSYINSGKLQEGTKLMIQGAELVNLEEGRYPLEITKDVRLKIHTNSTRRARWDTKLGYYRTCGPLPVTLSSVKSNGGAIGKLIVAVARVYPILYREKTADGQSIVRNAKCEEKAAIAYETECQKRIDAICSTARSFSESQTSTSKYELETRVRNNLPDRRNVTPILKVRIADNDLSAMMTIWSCDEEFQSNLKENSCIAIRNVLAAGRRVNELQITAGKSSIFERVATKITCPPRAFTSIQEVSQRGFNPVYGEFDTVGIVVSTGPAPHGMKNFETVNLAFKTSTDDDDDNNEDSSSYYLSILFWEGIASHGFTGIATVGSAIACLNLEWRKSTYQSIPTAFCSERTLLTRNPRQAHLRHAFDSLSARIRDPVSYAAECAAIIQLEVDKKSSNKSANHTPNADRRWSNCWTPERDNNLINPDSVNRNDLRKSAILNNRADKVRWHLAPESSILHISNSPKTNSPFNLNINRSRPS
ncbi:uncharacterized protein LOC103579169 [Microplitis demolitor]|uniref:uncharacterized protein LOC103579169 n=1 Tax=Microplitis demolitor TaxID=69319 RepID=UPI0004CD9EF1|nr:uncharacterized protein LOC103579169 [Microplitis demolitor]